MLSTPWWTQDKYTYTLTFDVGCVYSPHVISWHQPRSHVAAERNVPYCLAFFTTIYVVCVWGMNKISHHTLKILMNAILLAKQFARTEPCKHIGMIKLLLEWFSSSSHMLSMYRETVCDSEVHKGDGVRSCLILSLPRISLVVAQLTNPLRAGRPAIGIRIAALDSH